VRQLVSLRFWLAVLALAAMWFVLSWLLGGDDSSATPTIDSVTGVEVGEGSTAGATRVIDLIAPIQSVRDGDLLQVSADGTTSAEIELNLTANRLMTIAPETPGEVTCESAPRRGDCVVVADLLGEAVLWFAVIDGNGRSPIILPGVVEMLDNRMVRLANGWQLARSLRIDKRNCPDDVTTMDQIIVAYGADAVATFDIQLQQVIRVTCPAA
jgi:hypothetical protein